MFVDCFIYGDIDLGLRMWAGLSAAHEGAYRRPQFAPNFQSTEFSGRKDNDVCVRECPLYTQTPSTGYGWPRLQYCARHTLHVLIL
eukprot:scaffold157374_cov15-Prasinocladus_malaysianus.AAC.1